MCASIPLLDLEWV